MREKLRAELLPLLKGVSNMLEAGLLVNAWCVGQTEYRSSSPWDASAVETLRNGFGRCEELSILFVMAARSVGIPARLCYMPAWPDKPNNHAWPEFWTTEGWVPVAAAEPDADPQQPWFLTDVVNAPKVFALAWGESPAVGETALRIGKGLSVIERTPAYVRGGTSSIRVLDRNGVPCPNTRVLIWVCNNAVPILVDYADTDHSGTVSLALGPGEYLASAGNGQDFGFAVAGPNRVANLILSSTLPNDVQVLRWTARHPKASSPVFPMPPVPDKSLDRVLRAMQTEEKTSRIERLQAERRKNTLSRACGVPYGVAGVLRRGGTAGEHVLHCLCTLPPAQRENLNSLIAVMPSQDVLAAVPEALAAHLDQAARARQSWGDILGYDDTIFLHDVAAPRFGFAPFSLPSERVRELAASLRRTTPKDTSDAVLAFVDSLPVNQRDIFGPGFTPDQITRYGFVSSASDRDVLAGTLLRILGIPARLSAFLDTVELFDGDGWRLLRSTETPVLPLAELREKGPELAAGCSLVHANGEGWLNVPAPGADDSALVPEKTWFIFCQEQYADATDATLTPLQQVRATKNATPDATARKATHIVIDGLLDEMDWKCAEFSPRFVDLETGTPGWFDSRAAILWDDKYLYIGFRLHEPDLRAFQTERDSKIYEDNDIEVFIDGGDSYYELEINPLGTLYEAFWIWDDAIAAPQFQRQEFNAQTHPTLKLDGIGKHKHPRGMRTGFLDWDMTGLRWAVHHDGTLNQTSDRDTGWSAEIAIPWNSLSLLANGRTLPPSPGDVWRVDCSRFQQYDAQGNTLHRPVGWAWKTHGAFDSHMPETFPIIRFSNEPACGTDAHSGTNQ